MKCGGCVSRVKRILEGHVNVTQVMFVVHRLNVLMRCIYEQCSAGHILHCHMDRVAAAHFDSTIC